MPEAGGEGWSLGLAPLHREGLSGWAPVHLLSSCCLAAAASSSTFSLPSLRAKHLRSAPTGRLFSVCLGCDTIFILHVSGSPLYDCCLDHSVHLLSPGPNHIPFLPSGWMLPFLPSSGPSPLVISGPCRPCWEPHSDQMRPPPPPLPPLSPDLPRACRVGLQT